jgi:exopolyphosphatase/guanosine-5'-triphosphate,3'-diphosphate pyrophosphatase
MVPTAKGAMVGTSPNPKPANPKLANTKPKLGLRAWMERVLVECDRAAMGFDAEAVHDLRVALRRCRSLADGLMAIDSDSSWKDMKKAGRKLFQGLGELRDMQVMAEWIEKLGEAGDEPTLVLRTRTDGAPADDPNSGDRDSGDPVAVKLLNYVHAREAECKQRAFKDLHQFDRKQWRQWTRILPRRASRVRPGSVVYLHLALEKWTEAYDLHKYALRTRSQVAWHALRIGIKRFRYTVENFLPLQHALWGDDLKELQDLLGEVHDLNVLWATAVDRDVSAFPDVESRNRWREKLNVERARRIARYREKMVGRQSLWRVWRAELPSGPQLRAAAMSRLRVWARSLDPDFPHSQRVTQLALLLYDGLKNAGLVRTEVADSKLEDPERGAPSPENDSRAVLQAAALMHDVGKARGQENHQKKSYRMIRGMQRPLGWSARELELAAVVARYHRGALPRPRGKTMQALELPDRPIAMKLAGILRLAKALDTRHGRNRSGNEKAPRLEIGLQDHFALVRVTGYSALDRSAERVAAARQLLETVLRRPVLVRALRNSEGGSQSTGHAPVAKRLRKNSTRPRKALLRR